MIDEILEYAQKRLDEAISNGTLNDCVYWNGYVAGILAIKRRSEECQKA